MITITTKKHIEELQRILVQTCLDYINKYGLRDIYAIRFSADNLGESARYGEWHPATDSHIDVEGIRIEDMEKVPTRYKIGESF